MSQYSYDATNHEGEWDEYFVSKSEMNGIIDFINKCQGKVKQKREFGMLSFSNPAYRIESYRLTCDPDAKVSSYVLPKVQKNMPPLSYVEEGRKRF